MRISAIIDRIEDGYAFLLSKDYDLEIRIPVTGHNSKYTEGDSVSLVIKNDGSVEDTYTR